MGAEKFSKNQKGSEQKGVIEKGSRFGRDFNIAVGGVALIGATIAPPVLAVGLGVYAGINFAQAGAFEIARRYAQNKNKKASEKSKNK